MPRHAAFRLALAFAATVLSSTIAHSLPTTYVAVNGSDASTCARTTPCKTFANALTKTDAGGEIVVLLPGEYGPVTITKSVTISAVGLYAAINATTGDAVSISGLAELDVVVLRGLTLTGRGGDTGIRFASAGQLHVEGCTASGFSDGGITVTGGGNLFVKDTILRNNEGNIYIEINSPVSMTASIDHCRMEGGWRGLSVYQHPGLAGKNTVKVTVRDSVAANNLSEGYYASGPRIQLNVFDSEAVNNVVGFKADNGAKISAHHSLSSYNVVGFYALRGSTINAKDCTAANNTNSGAHASGSSSRVNVEGCQLVNNPNGLLVTQGATAAISETLVTGNGTGLKNDTANPGTLKSFGNNRVDGNTTNKVGTITAVGQM